MALGPLEPRVYALETWREQHAKEAAEDSKELQRIREWTIRAETQSEVNGRWIKALFGTTVLGFAVSLLALVDLLRRLGA